MQGGSIAGRLTFRGRGTRERFVGAYHTGGPHRPPCPGHGTCERPGRPKGGRQSGAALENETTRRERRGRATQGQGLGGEGVPAASKGAWWTCTAPSPAAGGARERPVPRWRNVGPILTIIELLEQLWPVPHSPGGARGRALGSPASAGINIRSDTFRGPGKPHGPHVSAHGRHPWRATVEPSTGPSGQKVTAGPGGPGGGGGVRKMGVDAPSVSLPACQPENAGPTPRLRPPEPPDCSGTRARHAPSITEWPPLEGITRKQNGGVHASSVFSGERGGVRAGVFARYTP